MQTMNELLNSFSFHSLGTAFAQPVSPTPLSNPRLVCSSPATADCLGLDHNISDELLLAFNHPGRPKTPLAHAKPIAMKYTGHQFGVYNPELGDGRGLLLGEREHLGKRWDIHSKGAGQTPFSRFGDGRAVLRSSIREFLCSEAMAGLGIPTTRALCIIGSDEPVMREKQETGALLIRVAESHVRFGHFEYLFYTHQEEQFQQLLDYLYQRHPDRYLQYSEPPAEAIFQYAVESTAKLVAQWQAVGFAHGVLNTDNMSIIGDTFDYGPFAFLDQYQPDFICNHSDHQGRYSFERQPSIGLWNLGALAHSFSKVLPVEQLQEYTAIYEPKLREHFANLMRNKLGLETERPEDPQLLAQLLSLMASDAVDYSICFRRLCDFTPNKTNQPLRDLFLHRENFDNWASQYQQRLRFENRSDHERQKAMRAANPKYILRNYLAQQAIEHAENGDFSEIERLQSLLENPFDEQPHMNDYAKHPPEWSKSLSISCSS